MRLFWGVLVALVFSLLAGGALAADAPPRRVLRVATVQSEPFVIYDETQPEEKRAVEGLSADIWRDIASRMNADTKWVFCKNMAELIDAIKTGKADAGIAAITISKERESYADFSNSMYESGLRILTRTEKADTTATFRAIMKRLFWNKGAFFVLATLVLVAHVLWLFNRLRKGDFVPTSYLGGIGDSLRWSVQVLVGAGGTTIPKKGVPWFLGVIWVFGGRLLFAVLAGVFSAAFALAAIENNINSIADLRGKRTAVVAGNAPEKYMEKINTTLVSVPTVKDGVEMVESGKVDAFVHDAPRLHFWRAKVNQRAKAEVLRVTLEDFNRQNYGIIFPADSKLRKDINLQLLNLREPKNPGEKSGYDEMRAKWIPQ
jgi:polar amino acid transport system substrate-binding protein